MDYGGLIGTGGSYGSLGGGLGRPAPWLGSTHIPSSMGLLDDIVSPRVAARDQP